MSYEKNRKRIRIRQIIPNERAAECLWAGLKLAALEFGVAQFGDVRGDDIEFFPEQHSDLPRPKIARLANVSRTFHILRHLRHRRDRECRHCILPVQCQSDMVGCRRFGGDCRSGMELRDVVDFHLEGILMTAWFLAGTHASLTYAR